MPQLEYGGRTYEVPEGTSPEDAINMIVRIKAVNPPPQAVPAPVPKDVPLGPNNFNPQGWSWIGGKLMETPEQRRKMAVDSLKILQKEYYAAPPGPDQQMLQQLADHAAFTATAENPHQVAKSKRPATTYRSIVSER